MVAQEIKLTTLKKDVQKKTTLENSFAFIVTELIKERQEETKREQKVIYDRFMSLIDGKQVLLENSK